MIGGSVHTLCPEHILEHGDVPGVVQIASIYALGVGLAEIHTRVAEGVHVEGEHGSDDLALTVQVVDEERAEVNVGFAAHCIGEVLRHAEDALDGRGQADLRLN